MLHNILKEKMLKKNSKMFAFVNALLIVSLTFLLCRAILFREFAVCGVALITVLLYRDRMNVYLLFPMLLGYASQYINGYMYLGDAVAMVVAAVVFTLFGSKYITFSGRVAIASIVSVTVNCAYFILSNSFYRISATWIITDMVLIVVLGYVFNSFFSFVNMAKQRNLKIKRPKELGIEKYIGAISVTLGLTICSFGYVQFMDMPVSVPVICCMVITLYWGYVQGISAGVISGVAVAAVLVFSGNEGVGIGLVLAAGGVAAGVFSDEEKYTSAICFSGACLGLGLIAGYPELSVNVFEPLISGLLFVFVPRAMVVRTRKVFSVMKKDIEYCELETKTQMLDILGQYQKTFQRLANLYGNAKSNRAIIAYQFKGMAQVTSQMMDDISHVRVGGAREDANSLSLQVAHAACGQKPGVSGDSFEYRDVSRDEYGILISDGMGKGKMASAESSLAVSTLMALISTGFDASLALKTVNNILLQQGGQEVFSTVDLALVDRLSGNLRLFKIGAAATFIKHQGKVQTVKMPALPMGIVDGLHVDFVNVRLRPGDQVVMISDGVSDSKREDLQMNWLRETIADIKSTDPQTVSDLIMNKAKENYGNRERDDMTVVTLVVA